MEKPQYFDATEGAATIVQKPQLEKVVSSAYWYGFEKGALPGSVGIAISMLLALVTSASFNNVLGLDGATWKALFVLILALSVLVTGYLLLKILRTRLSNIEDFFRENDEINK